MKIKLLLLIILSMILSSCNLMESRNKPVTQEMIDNSVQRAVKWIETHPANFMDGQFLEIGEAVVMFYVLYKYCDTHPKTYYLEQIKKRLLLLASKPDYKVSPQEYTIFTAMSYIMNELNLPILEYNKIIKEVLLNDPLLYPPYHITTSIWNHIFLEALGYKPQKSFEELIKESTLFKEIIHRQVMQATQAKFDKRRIDQISLTIYNITHEIFSLTAFGDTPPKTEILIMQQNFYAELFEQSIKWALKAKHIDLLAEIVMCSKILKLENSIPSLQRAINFILNHQEEDGSFGITNPGRANAFRHGVFVALMAVGM